MKGLESLFYEWLEICDRMKYLSGYFKNDLAKLLEDKTTTKDHLMKDIQNMTIRYEQLKSNQDRVISDVKLEMAKIIRDN